MAKPDHKCGADCPGCAYEAGADSIRVMLVPMADHLDWIAGRIINVYRESENVDFVQALKRYADNARMVAARGKA